MSDLSRPVVEQDVKPAAPARRSLGWGKIALGCLGTFVALWLLGGGGIWLYFHVQHRQALADVQAEVDRIHAAGEPITPEDMFAFHQVPPETNDTTKLWQRTFELVVKAQDEDAKLLPIIGEEDVDWQRLRPDHPESVAPIAERFFQKHDDAFQAILEAARADGDARFPVDYSKGAAADISHISELNYLSKLLSLRSRYALACQDKATFYESVEAMLKVALIVENDLGIPEQALRIVVLGRYCQEIQAVFSHTQFSANEIDHIEQRLKDVNLRDCMRLAMLGERSMGFHAFHHMSVLDSITKEHAHKYDGILARPVDCRYYLSVMRELVDATEDPLTEGWQRAYEVIEQVEKKRLSKSPLNRFPVVVTCELVPTLKYVFTAHVNGAVRRDSAIAGIAFRRYQLKHNRAPESLEQLAPEFLDAVPQDPFGPGTPLKLVIEDDQFAIYSVGWNSTDDRALFEDPGSNDDPGFVASLAVPGIKTQPNGAATESSAEATP